jgi:hypothetical protein
MYKRIKWINKSGKQIFYPYLYLIEAKWDKKRKMSVAKVIKYLGRASPDDIQKYYKGKKYEYIRNQAGGIK